MPYTYTEEFKTEVLDFYQGRTKLGGMRKRLEAGEDIGEALLVGVTSTETLLPSEVFAAFKHIKGEEIITDPIALKNCDYVISRFEYAAKAEKLYEKFLLLQAEQEWTFTGKAIVLADSPRPSVIPPTSLKTS